ncbi:MAG: MBL fold metallo-hydrolase [Acidobacteria bacterium]|nr:MAG: MBL fold metallo-hydrolase [Acidobacteriota bacterium]
MSALYFPYEFGITAIDAQYVRPKFAGSHLIVEGDQAVFIDTGTNYSVPGFMEVLKEKGLCAEKVRYIILTHIHLDHAGGAGALMKACPNAELVVHGRGRRHMIDPSVLIKGTYAVFGKENAVKLYGNISGVPESRVLTAEDEMTLSFNGRKLLFIDAPGHAKHHIAIWDEKSRGFFTGDAFGLSYRDFDTQQGEFILPTTTPIHFDPQAMRNTIDRILSYRPEAIYPTHFGRACEPEKLGAQLHDLIDRYLEIIAAHGDESPESRHVNLQKEMGKVLVAALRKHAVTLSEEACLHLLANDIDLNAQGLAHWWDTRNKQR